MAFSGLKVCGVCILLSGMALPQAQTPSGAGLARRAPQNASGTKAPPVHYTLPGSKSAPNSGTTAAPKPASTPSNPAAVPSTAVNRGTLQAQAPIKSSAAVLPQQQIGPPAPPQVQQPPLNPAQMAPVAPTVTYQDGLLTVKAPNSNLSDILNGIRSRAGIQFEGLQGGSERVAATLGPAPADEVLTDLLRGSGYDYVIVASPDNPDVVQRVLLTPRSGAPSSAVATAAPQPRPSRGGDPDEEDDTPSETVQQPQPGQMTVQQPPQQPPQNNNAVKTPEQLYEEMKQLQMRQQQQYQQNQQNQNPSMQNQNPPMQNNVPIKPKMPPTER
jgi:hypothetical protein